MWKAGIVIGTAALIQTALAQVSTNVTCMASTAWMVNSKNQNPCLVSAYLSSVCNNGAWTVPTLVSQGPYNPPQANGVTDCRCNTVVYSLISACSFCQGGVIGKWSDWIAYCPSTYVNNFYPRTVPSETDVPGWAELDPSTAGIWNPTAAQQYAATGSSGSSTNTPGPSASSTASSSNGGGKTNVGAIVGGVIGGIALLTAIGFLIWWLLRRSSYGKGQKVTPAPYNDAGLGDGGYAGGADGYEKERYPPHRLDMGTPAPSAPLMGGPPMNMKPYDPADPSTFPSSPSYTGSPAPDSTVVGHETVMQPGSYQSYPPQQQRYPHQNQPQYQPGAYSGAAEV